MKYINDSALCRAAWALRPVSRDGYGVAVADLKVRATQWLTGDSQELA